MPEVQITALGPVRRSLGFNHRTVEFDGESLEDMLRDIQTQEDGSLYDFMIDDEGTLKNDLAVFVNEKQVKCDELQRTLDEGDKVVTMQVIRPVRGGSDEPSSA